MQRNNLLSKIDGDYSLAFGNGVTVDDDYVSAFYNSTNPGKVEINNPDPHSSLQFDGSFATTMLVTGSDVDLSSGTAGEENFTILATAAITVTLPDATTCGGRIYAIRNKSTGIVKVNAAGPGNIEASTSDYEIPAGEGIVVQAQGGGFNEWWIIADFD